MYFNIYENKIKINSIIGDEDFVKELCLNNNYTYEKIEVPEKKSDVEQLQQENKLLKAQLQAQTERSDFIEDCIAEMAGVVYNTEETTM